MDYSHPGKQLSAGTDNLPRSGLGQPQNQPKPFLLERESERGAMPNTSRFLSPSVCPGHPKRGVKETSHSPLGAELPAAAVQGQLWLKLRARPPPQRQQEQGSGISGLGQLEQQAACALLGSGDRH